MRSRALLLAAGLLLGACAEPPPQPRSSAPEVIAPGGPATPLFAGAWRVVAVDGRAPPAAQSPILIEVGPELVHARADCANLGEPAYAVRGDFLSIQPPPRRLISSCARGLSEYEAAFTQVFKPGAAGRLRDGRLVLDYAGRTAEAVRSRTSSR